MTGAERQRLRRQRRRQGISVYPVPGDRYAIPDMLVDMGYLAQWDEDDPQAVGEAIARFLERTVIEGW